MSEKKRIQTMISVYIHLCRKIRDASRGLIIKSNTLDTSKNNVFGCGRDESSVQVKSFCFQLTNFNTKAFKTHDKDVSNAHFLHGFMSQHVTVKKKKGDKAVGQLRCVCCCFKVVVGLTVDENRVPRQWCGCCRRFPSLT